MHNVFDSLSSVFSLKSPVDIQDDVISVGSSDNKFNNMVSAFSKLSSTDSNANNEIQRLMKSPDAASNPDSLLEWQNDLGEYNNYISLVSALTRKTVSTIETLEKSQ